MSDHWTVSGTLDAGLAIAGASGFLGQSVAAELARQGKPARLLQRSGPGSGVALERALAGCTTVINCAGRAHVTRPESAEEARKEFMAANCELAGQLGRAARDAGATRFVQVSSVAAIRSISAPGELIDDQTMPAPGGIYGESKLAGDLRVLALARDGFRPVVLRPPAIYGPGAKGWFPSFLRAARAGVPLPLAGIANQRSFAFAGNIASAIAAVCENDLGGAWIVTDSPPMSTGEFYRLALEAAGHGNRVFGVPAGILAPLVRMALKDRAESLVGNAAFDASAFIEQTRWRPPWTPAEGMRLTFNPVSSGNAHEQSVDA